MNTALNASVPTNALVPLPWVAVDRRRRITHPLRSAAWDLAVATELAAPGTLELYPVLKAREIVDFEFLSVCSAAAAFLGAIPDRFENRTVRDLLGTTPEADRIISTYRRTAESGQPQIHVGAGCSLVFGSAVLHHVLRVGTRLLVVLTCPDAVAREAEARAAFHQLESVAFTERRCPRAQPSR
jgi:hypothetical protein